MITTQCLVKRGCGQRTRRGQCYKRSELNLDLSTRQQNGGVEGQGVNPCSTRVVFSGDVLGGHILCSQCMAENAKAVAHLWSSTLHSAEIYSFSRKMNFSSKNKFGPFSPGYQELGCMAPHGKCLTS